MDVQGQDSFVSVVDLLGAEVEHFLCFFNATDHRACEGPASQDEGECLDRKMFRWCADVDECAVKGERLQVGVDVDRGADGDDDQVKCRIPS